MIPRISLQDIAAGIAAAMLLPYVILDLSPRMRGRDILAAAVGILLLVLLCSCASGPLGPMTPLEEDRIACRAMAQRGCGTHQSSVRCRNEVATECMALKGWTRKGGKLVKKECRP